MGEGWRASQILPLHKGGGGQKKFSDAERESTQSFEVVLMRGTEVLVILKEGGGQNITAPLKGGNTCFTLSLLIIIFGTCFTKGSLRFSPFTSPLSRLVWSREVLKSMEWAATSRDGYRIGSHCYK